MKKCKNKEIPNQSKNPKSKFEIEPGKLPKYDKQNITTYQEKPVWSVAHLCKEGEYGWFNIKDKIKLSDILDKLKNFETMTWQDIKGPNNHYVKISDICKEAKQHLEEMKLDDIDALFSLRLTGTNRIFGILDNGIYSILWWDENHKIYPSYKKHT